MQRGKWLLVAAALGAAVLLPAVRGERTQESDSAGSAPGAAAEAGAPAPGTKAIDFTLPDPEGKKTRLRDMRGKVVVLSFWATWCPPCREELPHLDAIHRKYQDKPVRVLAVNLDQQGSALRQWLKDRNLTFTALADADQSVAKKYRVEGIPTLFVIDQKGRIRHRAVGYDPNMEKEIGQIIDGLLRK